MDDEIKLLKQRDLGARAKRLREDELLTRIFEGLKDEYMREWAQSNSLESIAREVSYHKLRGLMAMREQINGIIKNGETAKTFLEHAEKNKAA